MCLPSPVGNYMEIRLTGLVVPNLQSLSAKIRANFSQLHRQHIHQIAELHLGQPFA